MASLCVPDVELMQFELVLGLLQHRAIDKLVL